MQMAVSFVAAMFLILIPEANEALDHRAVWAVSGLLCVTRLFAWACRVPLLAGPNPALRAPCAAASDCRVASSCLPPTACKQVFIIVVVHEPLLGSVIWK